MTVTATHTSTRQHPAMPDWRALFGDTPAAEVAVWLFAAFIVVSLLIKVWPFLTKLVALGNALPSLTALPDFMTQTEATLAKPDGLTLGDTEVDPPNVVITGPKSMRALARPRRRICCARFSPRGGRCK